MKTGGTKEDIREKCTLRVLTRWVKHLKCQQVGGGGLQVAYLGSVVEVMVIQATLFTSNYNYRVVQLFYKTSFIFVESDLHMWSLSDCKQPSLWPLLRKTIIPLCIFLEFHISLVAIQHDRFKILFTNVFKGFKSYTYI